MDFDPARRAAEKQASRDADQRALESGEKSREELSRENSLFAFPNVEVDLKGAQALVWHGARAAEKQASRDADQQALESGAKSREELRRECGLLSFRKVKVHYTGVRPGKVSP
jgi:hypothetical protein